MTPGESHRSDASTCLINETALTWQDGECHYNASDGQSMSHAVIGAVNKCIERDNDAMPITEQPSLFEAINPDALDDLFTKPQSGTSVQFMYAGYEITVEGDGKVIVGTSSSVPK